MPAKYRLRIKHSKHLGHVGIIEKVNIQAKTFDLSLGGDPVYHVNAKKISKVTVQHSPKSPYFTVMEKISTIKDGDNAYVKGYFNSKTLVIRPKSIRIAN